MNCYKCRVAQLVRVIYLILPFIYLIERTSPSYGNADPCPHIDSINYLVKYNDNAIK